MNRVPDKLASNKSERIPGIDRMRGMVIVLMTLDHVRDFFSNAEFSPTDLDKTSAALFLTRWITHFCAPVFIFLAGASAYLSSRHTGTRQLSRFLLTRGLWIAFLGITFESLVWSFWPESYTISGSVLWAIGWSMICLSALVSLPPSGITLFGFTLIAGHNYFDGITQQSFGSFGPLWAILHSGETIPLTKNLAFDPYYPLVPWIGVMAAGYAFGKVMLLPQPVRNKILLLTGATLTLLFIALRLSNGYGDPNPWSTRETAVFTLLSFLNCDKYPPSLCYLLMTLGPAIAALPLFDRLWSRAAEILQIFGQTSMFFYLLHLPLIILLSLVNAWLHSKFYPLPHPVFPDSFPQAYGYGLPVVYLVWLVILTVLYPLCRRFREFKRTGASLLLRYL